MKNIEKVSVVKCNDYNKENIDKAVEKAVSLIDFDFSEFKGKNVLIKPNVVGVFPKKQIATTTHPVLVESVCKILKKNKCKIFIGDSPFTNPEDSFKAAGIDKIAKKYGKLVIFEQDKLVRINDKKAKVLKRFQISKTLKNADLVINMPKLKTHSLTKFTGSVKNLYGVILGGMKQRVHLKAKGDRKFSNVLVDIYQNIKPELTIMDGVIGMEGEGPTSGDPVKTKLILCSKNGVALDITACKIISLNPKTVYTLKECVKRKLYPSFKTKVIGKMPKFKFEIPDAQCRSKAKAMICKLFKEKPIICNTKKCIKCGLCASKCPAKAIKMNPYPEIDKKKCIRCFCCIEICPQDALSLQSEMKSH
tara:strand:- start:149 stop:1237 length:1089 start_codon:yes stop_codon:yes gene_type:complete